MARIIYMEKLYKNTIIIIEKLCIKRYKMEKKTTVIITEGKIIKRRLCRECRKKFFGEIPKYCPDCGKLIEKNREVA